MPGIPSDCDNRGRYQDFCGGLSRKAGEWPDLPVDTALLHSRYQWQIGPVNAWDPEHPALPEVNWSVRTFGTEILYKYRSLYGQSTHPLGYELTFHGRPVAHRYETSQFRTVHFNFTLLALDQDSVQIVVDSVLNWLYNPDLGAGLEVSSRYRDAPVKITVSEAKENYRQRCRELRERRGEPTEFIID